MIPHSLGLSQLRRAYREGSSDPVAIMREVLRRCDEAADPAIWIARAPSEQVLARAHALASDPAARELPLFGIPFAVKDNIDAAGLATTAGCPAFGRTAERDAPVVAALLAAGAVLVGKTNLDQFATGLVGTRSPYGAPRSVFSRGHISGGSSSGSAVAVASDLVSFALGTDTAGSGRVPAALNGIVGLKPTRGLISTCGIVPACRSLDCVSIFAREVRDARIVAAIAMVADDADPSLRRSAEAALPSDPLRVGVLREADREFDHPGYARLYQAAIARAEARGHTIVTFDYAPFRAAGGLLYGGAFVAERTEAVGDFIAAHPGAVDPVVRRIIDGGRVASAVELFGDQHRLRAHAHAAKAAGAAFDVMLLPATPGHPTVEEVAREPVARNARLGLYANFVNLLDMAAIAVPAGSCSDGLPFGVTLVGPAFSDGWLADLASALTETIPVVVVGAHLSGMPLNRELTALGGSLRRRTRTAPHYRLYALARTTPPKPALVRRPEGGASIEVEVWELPPEGFGRFVAGVPAPLGIGKIMVEDGEWLPGFICEPEALSGAEEITSYGGWRAWTARAVNPPPASPGSP